jgi:hypothetical protein
MKPCRSSAALLLLVTGALFAQQTVPGKQPPRGSDVLLATMEKELQRGESELAKQDPAPYFTSYNVTDTDSLVVVSAQGGVLNSTRNFRSIPRRRSDRESMNEAASFQN